MKTTTHIDQIFVDWNGDIRSVRDVGDGLRCEVVQRNGYTGVDVIAPDGEVIFEAVCHTSTHDLNRYIDQGAAS